MSESKSQQDEKDPREAEIEAVQEEWGKAIEGLGKVYVDGACGDKLREVANEAITKFYAYGKETVLFKPTKAAVRPFRPTPEGALSYFLGPFSGVPDFPEDGGFGINPWREVEFKNHRFVFGEDIWLAMGHYYFLASDGSEAKVEYTFGYKKIDGKLKIVLHHSSAPYSK